MLKNLTIATVVLLFIFNSASGQTEYLPKKVYKAFRVSKAPVINGTFDDEAWNDGEWGGDFTQFQPYADKPASQRTEFKLGFDDTNIYIAIKAYDTSPDSITNRMSRRDAADGDMVFVMFDTYHDLRTGFTFGVSSAGVRFDQMHLNDGQQEDPTWDPIWQAKAQIHDWGWGAEMKIPFTQLRFKKNSDEVWGFEPARQIFRNNELSLWHAIPRTAPGLVHAIGELDGLQEIEPRKQLDLTPYAVGSVNTYEAEPGNPYADGFDPKYDFGLDGKVGVTNNLTLDFTVNPDFGQVEADPSEVNLSAFETFFEEKRPFFIEGKSIMSFNVGLGDGDVGNDNLFYSRRIGRRPHGYPSLSDGEYAHLPIFSRILGAAKLTGKTQNGWSIGVMESVTADTKATISNSGEERKETVEPLTNYSLLRLQKDFNKGNTILGVGVTNTFRKLDGTDLDWLNKNATTTGVDINQFFKDRTYNLNAALYFSDIQGSTDAIAYAQSSSARYFQRPDARYVEYDDTRTSLTGQGGKLIFGKVGGNWNFMTMNIWKSPGLELNDMGYMREADILLNVLWTGYNFTEPFSIFRDLHLNGNVYVVHDFGGRRRGMGLEYNVNANFKNLWNGGFGGGYNFAQVSNNILRGGPSMLYPNSTRLNYRLFTNRTKSFSGGFFGHRSNGAENSSKNRNFGISMTIRPFSTMSISLSPSYSTSNQVLQYVTRRSFNSEDRYLFGSIDQKVLSMSLRINYNITPDLTIQYWGQPFVASGDYSDFKMITDPNADEFINRFHVYTSQEINMVDDYYEIDEDNDLSTDYGFGNPNFNVDEWISNLVIRWEFLPGSTAYLVWSQSRNFYDPTGEFDVGTSLDNLFTYEKANNTILFKISYRFGLR